MCPLFPDTPVFLPPLKYGAILYKIIRRSRGETIGTRIDRDNSFIMPLRLRGGYATECHAFSYYTSSSALIFSPPCGSCSVFEVAHFVYKHAWFLKKCRKNIKNSAKIALKYLQNYFIYNIIQNEPASQRSVFCSKGG